MSSLHSLCLAILSFALLFSCGSNALPILKQEVLAAKPVTTTCDSVSTYTTEWFLANTLPEYRKEVHNNALFYTRGTSQIAQKLAHEHPDHYTTIWEVWPCYLYNDRQDGSNPLRCIHEDHEQRRTFYENMSRAFARMARKSATVMHGMTDYADVPQDGIWARVELPALRDGTDVAQLRKISQDLSNSSVYAVTRGAWDTVEALIQKAMDEVRAIFRAARLRQSDNNGAACSMWSSADDAYLDSLW